MGSFIKTAKLFSFWLPLIVTSANAAECFNLMELGRQTPSYELCVKATGSMNPGGWKPANVVLKLQSNNSILSESKAALIFSQATGENLSFNKIVLTEEPVGNDTLIKKVNRFVIQEMNPIEFKVSFGDQQNTDGLVSMGEQLYVYKRVGAEN
ncbi:MAG: hypothetical protein H6626_00105 [Pseudobdellovibrionaceae bacterium]|nr:hypothetical protein [Bdellovibrionales bacterium]USN47536.1 MAG: hypothetical protein H6626_00105 [Pseudobdellovibrionaceae bacterium]